MPKSNFTPPGSVFALLAASVVVLSIVGTGFVVPAAAGSQRAIENTDLYYAPSDNVSEEPYMEAVPERGDRYFEAEASDGSWVSYINPRDKYRSPYLGSGSGKICVTLLNRDGEVIVGESIPNTTVRIDTGESLEWHEHADPLSVRFPLTHHYERPLDADQLGTDPAFAQGDGYLDSHCIEFHGLPEDGNITYGEATIHGDYADAVDVVGYLQRENEAWDSDVDPIADARAYESAGGWEYHPGGSHGQALVVLQLNPENGADNDSEATSDDSNESNSSSDDSTREPNESRADLLNQASWTTGFDASTDVSTVSEPNSTRQRANSTDEQREGDTSGDSNGPDRRESLPGFTVLIGLIALSIGIAARFRR